MAAHEQALITKRLPAKTGVRIKTIALPAEHGGWGLLFEPIMLGLLLAPSFAGLYLALGAVGLFLARQPLTLLVLNRRYPSPRAHLAKHFAAFYLCLATLAVLVAAAFAQRSFLWPLLMAAPMALIQIAHDWTCRRRVLLSEVAGALAISSLAPAIAVAQGWSNAMAFALWAILAARAVPAILYVRAFVARRRGKPASISPVLICHVVAVIMVAVLARASLAPRLVVVAMAILLMRATIGLIKSLDVTAKQLGFSEIGFGALTIFAVVLGHKFGF